MRIALVIVPTCALVFVACYLLQPILGTGGSFLLGGVLGAQWHISAKRDRW